MLRKYLIIKSDLWVLFLDILAVNGAYFMALVLRFYQRFKFISAAGSYLTTFIHFAPLYSVICVIVFALFKLYKGMWRYAGLTDLNRIVIASVTTSVLHVVGTLLLFRRMPISYYVIGATIQFVLVGIIRFSYRFLVYEHRRVYKKNANAIIIGEGEFARYMIKVLDEGVMYSPACLISKENNGDVKDGLPVYAIDELPEAINKHSAKCVLIADAELVPETREQIKKTCENNGVELRDYSNFIAFVGESDSITGMMDVVQGSVQISGKRSIPFSPPDISEKEIGEVVEALRSGWITTGPRTKLLERRLAAYIETGRTDVDTESMPDRWKDRLVCLNSATAGEELNLRILGVGPGDEVIVPAYSYTASASAAIHCGATVVFVDIQKDGNPDTHCPEMDYDALEAAITEKTKAIVPVDIGGIVCDYDRIFEIVEKKRGLYRPMESDGTPLSDLSAAIQRGLGCVAVVSDCAHSLGASRVVAHTGEGEIAPTRRYCGRIAHFSSFSFHAVKNYTTAEGGASTWCLPEEVYQNGVSDAQIYKFYQLLSLHGQNKDALAKTKVGAWEYDIIGPWYKCNMTDIMAAIGLRQLDRYLGLLERREVMMKRYDATCDELGLSHMIHHVYGMNSSNHLYLIRVPNIDVEARNLIIEKMAERGVATNVHYKPMPMMTAYKALGWDIKDFPNAYDYYHNLITLPFHTLLADEDVEYVCVTLKEVVSEVR